MKKIIITSILALLLTGTGAMRAQDKPDEYLGLPGDNLNLYAVMKLFQESETLEAFERNLNDENSRINNLDLNGDNLIDYITVSDYADGNFHTIVLRAALSRNESQDLAVFTVEKLRNGEVRIQLIGDEALYGKNYIIEPAYAGTANPGYMGNRSNVTVVTSSYYDVASWPVVRFIFFPGYIAWHSSWYWGYYPVYWNPWRPWYWHYYYGYHSHWYPHYYGHYYHHHHYHHYAHYHDNYYSHIRHHSPAVYHGIREGRYNATYSRPDQRREGEAFARTAANRNPRTAANASGNTGERRTFTQSEQNMRTAAGDNVTARRSTSTAVERTPATQRAPATQRSTAPAVGRQVTRPATTTQRSTAPAVNRQVTRPATTTQRSTAPAVNRQATRPATTQRSAPTRSSAPAVSQRSSSRPSTSVHHSAPARSPGSSASSSRSVSRSSSQSNRSAAPASKSAGAKSSSSGRR